MRLYREFRTQEELDREYNAAAAVADSDAVIRGWLARSAAVLDRLEARLGIAYGPTRAEHLDVFPAGRDRPVHVFFHGGYWRRFAARDFAFLAPAFVEAGITLVNVNYALCPMVSVTEIVRQARAAVAWIARHADEFGGDPGRITISGHSAGGHLVAMTAFTDWPGDYDLPADVVKGGLAISGLFDLAPFPWTWLQPTLQLDWGEVLRLSPILHVPDRAPPLLIAVGGAETAEFRRQSRDFHAACLAKGLTCGFLEAEGLDHFRILEELERPDSELFAAVLDLVRGE
ncbi:Carboxylesterase NlhH [bacterium HR40]|nr:Carboxylesterase NlhH [bacterium HR40]